MKNLKNPPGDAASAPAKAKGLAKHAQARAAASKQAKGLAPKPAGNLPAAPAAKPKVSSPKKKSPASARAIAISVLSRVAATDAYLNLVLDTVLTELQPADSRDAAFATELCYGTTRHLFGIDYALRLHCDRRLETIEDRVLAALRIGAYQIFFMRVPSHAAVSDTVNALKELNLERAAGFANAILRKLAARETLPLPEDTDRAAFLSVTTSHPGWLVRRWLRQFGPERAEAMLNADNVAPSVVVRVNTTRNTRDELLAQFAEVGVKAAATVLSPLGITLESPGKIEDLFGFSEGLWQVQDEAAQLVTVFAQIPPSAKVLDVCAAPGGKTCHIAQTNSVTALDFHANKLPKINSEAKRLGLHERIKTQAHDGTKPIPGALGEFDVVMVDAPCSGLGTLRRHPELRYRRTEKDFVELAALQRKILETAQAVVAPGGLLIFAVCSTDTTEGADQVEMFLRSHPDFTSESPVGLPALPSSQGHLRTLPGPEGLDGFFAARLRKMY